MDLSKSLLQGGILYLTTAKNLPQFDHLYNFENPAEFEQKLKSYELEIIYKDVIVHNNLNREFSSNNIFYVCKKNL